jgi:hypothetical protein
MGCGPFVPQYLLAADYAAYNLPDATAQSDIDGIVQIASVLIDEACGRIDGDGNGSLCYTTYTERILLGSNNRNLVYVSQKPIAAVASGTVAALMAAGASGTNTFYTGVQANTFTNYNGALSGLIGASGRYGYTRNDRSLAYPDLFAFINPLNLVTMFGGPAPFVSIDCTQVDYDPRSGECWLPAGLQLQRYSEILIQYNAGYNPLQMPNAIKFATASVAKNLLAKGDATTALLRMQVQGAASFGMGADVIDPIVDRMLLPFKSVRGM